MHKESVRVTQTMLHIGKFIKEELERQHKSPTWLAHEINCERPNIYNIFGRCSMDSELIARLSIALKVNIFELLAKEVQKEQIQQEEVQKEEIQQEP